MEAVKRRIDISRVKRHHYFRTAEQIYWHANEQKCQEKLALILNSGIDLMKSGYQTALNKKFPEELSKKGIAFILKKYNIPHWQKVKAPQ